MNRLEASGRGLKVGQANGLATQPPRARGLKPSVVISLREMLITRSVMTTLAPHPSRLAPRPSSLPRRGLTLVELLVVIVLLLIVTAVAIPVLSPNSEQRRIREGARLVSSFLSGARNRAIELGRPVGVQFERLASNNNASMVLSYVEVPPLYAGDTLDAACRIYQTAANTGQCTAQIVGSFNSALVQPGDLFRVNFQGYSYRIVSVSGSTLTLQAIVTGSMTLPWAVNPSDPSTLPSYPYQITRQPIKSSGAPLQLPEGAVVDLNWSGVGAAGIVTSSTNPLEVLISPDGRVAATYGFDGTATPQPATGPIHLLIGKPEKAIAGGDPTSQDNVVFNYQDGNNLWVSIGPQTGLVSTAEVARTSVTLGSSSTWADGVNSRAIAQSFQSMGGR
jgi:prepilin-type N-terminal cleavage/methylation domain-containing protein